MESDREKRPGEGKGRYGRSDTVTTNHHMPTDYHLYNWGGGAATTYSTARHLMDAAFSH